MEIIDSQIHEPVPPKALDPAKYDEETRLLVNVELAREAIDSVGIDVALCFASQEFCDAAVARYPDRFAGAVPYDAFKNDADLEERVAKFRKRPGNVAIRNSPGNPSTAEIRPEFVNGEFERLYTYCEKYNVPLFFSTHGQANLMEPVIQAHPGLTVVIDHLGLAQAPVSPRNTASWAKLPNILALAKYPNVHVKFCGAPTLSKEKFPYNDVWPFVHQMVNAFTPDRLFWGSDYTRMRSRPADLRKPGDGQPPRTEWWFYSDVLNYLRDTNELSASDKEKMLGGAIRKALRWPKVPDGATEPVALEK
jgi:predicted TIM-barrel fold metal-dependent hydrolase